MKNDEIKVIAQNKKAFHDYFVVEALEAGIELYGTEVKSIRQGKINLKDAWCSIDNGEIYAIGVHISPFEQGNIFNKDPLRRKRLLLHKKQIAYLFAQVKQEGLSIIPLKLYFKGSYAKMEIGLCKGKKNYDKRAVIAKKSADREIQRVMKERYR